MRRKLWWKCKWKKIFHRAVICPRSLNIYESCASQDKVTASSMAIDPSYGDGVTN